MRIVRRVDGIHEKGQRTCREGQPERVWKVRGHVEKVNLSGSGRYLGPTGRI